MFIFFCNLQHADKEKVRISNSQPNLANVSITELYNFGIIPNSIMPTYSGGLSIHTYPKICELFANQRVVETNKFYIKNILLNFSSIISLILKRCPLWGIPKAKFWWKCNIQPFSDQCWHNNIGTRCLCHKWTYSSICLIIERNTPGNGQRRIDRQTAATRSRKICEQKAGEN